MPREAAAANATRELAPGRNSPRCISIYLDSDYDVRVAVERKDGMGKLALKVDGARGCSADCQQQGRGAAAVAAGAEDAARARLHTAFGFGSRAVCACFRWSPMERRFPSRV